MSLKANWKAIVEIYTLRTVPNISDLKFQAKIVEHVANVLIIFPKKRLLLLENARKLPKRCNFSKIIK
jgi:hypothetical protein